MQNFTIKDLILNALIGAIYVVLVYALSFMSYGGVQFRIAEVLLVLLFFNPKLAFGIILGTFISNIGSPLGVIDSIFGTTATIVGIMGILLLKKRPALALLVPVIANGIIVAIMLKIALDLPVLLSIIGVSLGEAVVLYLLGLPFYTYIKKREDIIELIR